VEVAALDEKPESGVPDGNGSAGCIFMEIPGSRIKEQRCYYPSQGERALNEYQFNEEIRYSILQQQQRDLLRSEAEATLESYSQMFRTRP
jgi:hypothetical protein